jgi:hypothetical protein
VCFLLRDRDAKFSRSFNEVFRSEGGEVLVTPVRAPKANSYAERWVRTVRAECLDWLLIVGRSHLEQIVRVYVQHYNGHRPHRALGLAAPDPPAGLTVVGEDRQGRVRRRDCSAVCSTSTGELHERVCAPFRPTRCRLWLDNQDACDGDLWPVSRGIDGVSSRFEYEGAECPDRSELPDRPDGGVRLVRGGRMSGDVMRTQGSRWRSATVQSVFLVLVVALLVLVSFALLRRPDRDVPAEEGGLGSLTSNLVHDAGFVLLGLAVLILVVGCFLVFPRALVPDTLLDERQVMPLGEFTTARNDARSVLVNAVAGLLLGVTAVFTWQQLAISREGQITERFTRAVELLGSDDRAVRVGAIRALERLSKDSRSDDRAIYGLLNAYIRHHSPYRPGRRPDTAPAGPASGTGDATTDARQQERAERVDCERRFPGLASLQKCAFDVYLALQALAQRPATLSDGQSFAPLLVDTDLRGAQLGSARFHGADLRGAVLDGLSCYSPRPPSTDLGEARLQGASLKGARFYGADLRGAHLEGAKLTGADLSEAHLEKAKLAGATYDTRTRFPDGFDPETHGLLLVPDAG